MAGEAVRRSVMLVATLLAQVYFSLRVFAVELSLTADMVLKALPVVLLGCVALLAHFPLPGQLDHLAVKMYADRVGMGLILSSVGDLFLVLEWGFVPGLAFFLLAHVCYASAFKVDSAAGLARRRGSLALWQARFATGVWGVLLLVVYSFLSEDMDDQLKYPVVAYVAAIGTMVYRAVGRYDLSCGTTSYWWSAWGALIFAASDMLLAYNKFVAPEPVADYMVMFLYYAGQIMICNSTIVDDHLGRLSKQAKADPEPSEAAKTKAAKPSTARGGKNNKKRK